MILPCQEAIRAKFCLQSEFKCFTLYVYNIIEARGAGEPAETQIDLRTLRPDLGNASVGMAVKQFYSSHVRILTRMRFYLF